MSKPILAIHGGAGTVVKSSMTPALEAEYRSGLEDALRKGWGVLEANGTALDAVQAAVTALEDFPLFNAGRGSVFTHDGRQEMDASIMDGSTLRAGAVAEVRNIRNPILLARAVMDKTVHVLLAGEGAMQFAAEQGFALEPDEYFFTEHRWLQLQDAISSDRVQLDHAGSPPYEGGAAVPVSSIGTDGVVLSDRTQKPIGTVGAVACDSQGRLAAATSTGGMTNKKFGRVGDTPLIGAGTYANELCAVSCTGHGEYFMRAATAFDVAARMAYKGLSLEDAANETVSQLTAIGGEGGLIAVDKEGTVTLPFNSEGMYRGSITDSGIKIGIYK
ncbi:MAG: isoaspartyl peptidase/L-asparaginase [Acidobacteria bacterium]|nr:isoaspartyl peptidase/L-asparaginase [Acidobacteriota bacterium]